MLIKIFLFVAGKEKCDWRKLQNGKSNNCEYIYIENKSIYEKMFFISEKKICKFFR